MVQEIVFSSSQHQPGHDVAESKLLLRATYVWKPAADDDDEDLHDNDGDLGDNCVGDDETPAQMIKTASCMNSLCVQALSLNQCDWSSLISFSNLSRALREGKRRFYDQDDSTHLWNFWPIFPP